MFKKLFQRIQSWVWATHTLHAKSRILRVARITWYSYKRFVETRCIEKASALTYYTLLSLVPLLAMAFAITKGFGLDVRLERFLNHRFADKPEFAAQLQDFATSLLNTTNSGVIAGVGLVVLFWSVIKVMGNIESALNHIWAVQKQRSFTRKISDYFTIVLLAPLLLFLSNSATSFVALSVQRIAETTPWVQSLSGIITFTINLLPYSLIWFAFTLLYMVMPNTRVAFRSAFLGGFIAGVVFQIVQFAYVYFQIGVSNYNAIYGSFAALPLFLAWLQTSWIVVLLGAEIAYAAQNITTFESEIASNNMSHSLRISLSLWILHAIILRFEEGKSALRLSELSETLSIPQKLLSTLLSRLIDAGLLCENRTIDEKYSTFTPALSPDFMTVQYCVQRMETVGVNEISIPHSKQFAHFVQTLNYESCGNSTLLKTI
ncbi:MAG: YihY/virulence factor BrkB family protein [Bacteroidales bacterium]|jgi:membrane protein|nr:YihY/virulence factor BrkB family protein [Bacteroidales bacterium]